MALLLYNDDAREKLKLGISNYFDCVSFRVAGRVSPEPFKIQRHVACALSKKFADLWENCTPGEQVYPIMDLPNLRPDVFDDFMLWQTLHYVLPTRLHGVGALTTRWVRLYGFAMAYEIYELDKYIINGFHNLQSANPEKGMDLVDIGHILVASEQLKWTNLMRLMADILFYGKTKQPPWYDFQVADTLEGRTGFRVQNLSVKEGEEPKLVQQQGEWRRHPGVVKAPTEYYLECHPGSVADTTTV